MVFVAQVILHSDSGFLCHLMWSDRFESQSLYEEPVLFHKKEDAVKYLADRMESDIIEAVNGSSRWVSADKTKKQELKDQDLNKYFVKVENDGKSQYSLKPCYKGNPKALKRLTTFLLKGRDVEQLRTYKLKEIEIR